MLLYLLHGDARPRQVPVQLSGHLAAGYGYLHNPHRTKSAGMVALHGTLRCDSRVTLTAKARGPSPDRGTAMASWA